MGNDWIETTIGEFSPFQYGKGLPKHKREAGPYPVFGSNGPVGSHDTPLVEEPGIIIGRKGTVGAVHYSKQPFWPIDTTFYVLPDDHRDLRFTYYLLKSLGLHRLNADSAVPGLNRETAHALKILVPPLPEQRAIAHILGTLDDKIELNRRMNETLEAMARALFKSWFVDFDPVVVDAIKAGNPIPEKFAVRAAHYHQNPAALRLPEHILRLFPDRFVDSELGPIPEGWEVKALDEIAHFQNGLALQKYRPKPGEARLPVVKIAQLRSGQPDSGEWASANIRPDCIINDGDVVFSWSGSLILKIWCGGRAALNQHLFKVTSHGYPTWFYYYWIAEHLPEFIDIASDKATTMGHIKRHHLSEAKCSVPCPKFLEDTSFYFDALFSRWVHNELENRSLASIRDTLLPKLISGEYRIGDVEEILEDTL